ncbi:hypothetical protein [Alysiella crassa]|uniref:Uncharacterized protein n=1 Tax=Alysiella crassa TaxID=153491 RepID=A0A376BNI5_9NEIS|nr:hypothetical protein [Alysiella crassa]UOP06669.1 hypothetical protein LVJ80_13210 [Alysiella crassa]SSY71228.1 Uncharacterised protein [Alysiella crassa]
MADLPKHTENADKPENEISGSLKTELSPEEVLKAKKRRTLIIWLRVIALMFAAFFFLSKCGMSKSDAKIAIMESCIKNVPFSPQWQAALKSRNLVDGGERMAADYCVCMWNEPLQKLGVKQIQSFSKISQEEQLNLLGGKEAFIQRDKMCMDKLK